MKVWALRLKFNAFFSSALSEFRKILSSCAGSPQAFSVTD